jgi:curved DNA-binding protein CbpA
MQPQTSSSILRARALSYQEVRVLASLILEEPNHYAALGVDPRASFEEINKSYCLAVTHFHPLNHRAAIGSDTVFHWLLSRAFTRLGAAYRILSNARQRELYDGSLNASRLVPAHNQQDEKTPSHYALDDEEQLNLRSFSFATPEWLSAKRRSKDIADGERRRVERVKIHIPVVVTCESQWQETGETRDLSPLGAKFAITRRVEPGALLRLQLRMPRQFRTRHYHTESYMVDAQALHISESKPMWLIAVEFI